MLFPLFLDLEKSSEFNLKIPLQKLVEALTWGSNTQKAHSYQNNSFNFDLFSDTHTLRIQCEYTRTQCVGGAEEVKIERVILIATMQNIFRKLDIFSFSLSEDFIPITDSGTSDHFR